MEPSREGLLAAFTELYNEATVAAAVAAQGITTVASVAARDAFYATPSNQSKLVYVNNNNGSASDPANGVYEYVGGAPRIAEGFYAGLISFIEPYADAAEAAATAAENAAYRVSPMFPGITPHAVFTNLIRVDAVNGLPDGKALYFTVFYWTGGNFRAVAYYSDPDGSNPLEFANELFPAAGFTGEQQIVIHDPVDITVPRITLTAYFGDGSPWSSNLTDGGTIANARVSLLSVQYGEMQRDEIKSIAVEGVEENGAGVFVSTVDNPFLRRFIKRIRIERGVPGRAYLLRHRIDNAAGLRRIQLFLYDPVAGKVVAERRLSNPGSWPDVPRGTIFLANFAAGSPINSASGAGFENHAYVGVSATVWVDVDALDDANHVDETSTDPAVLGIDPANVLTRTQVRDMLRSGVGVTNEDIIVDPDGDGDFLKLQDALASLLDDPDSPRSWWPYSNQGTPSAQIHIHVRGDTPLNEEWVENVVDQNPGGSPVLIGQGMLVWAGLNIYLKHDTVLHTTGSATYAGPLFEFSFGGRLVAPITARGEQRGEGYVGHMDEPNEASIPSEIAPAEQVYQLVATIDGATWWAASGQDDWIWGRGTSDDEDVLFCNGAMKRETGSTSTKGYYGSHTSAGSVVPGRTRIEDMIFNDGEFGSAKAVELTKSNAQTTRHAISFTGSQLTRLAEGRSGGSAGWVRIGAMPPGVTVTGSIDL